MPRRRRTAMNEINRRSIRRYTALVEDLFACSCTSIEIVFCNRRLWYAIGRERERCEGTRFGPVFLVLTTALRLCSTSPTRRRSANSCHLHSAGTATWVKRRRASFEHVSLQGLLFIIHRTCSSFIGIVSFRLASRTSPSTATPLGSSPRRRRVPRPRRRASSERRRFWW